MTQNKKPEFVCSIYNDRPKACIGYPWNMANQIFVDCQFYDREKAKLLSMEEILKNKTNEEINEYCIDCGQCCFFGHAKCSKLDIK